VVRELLNLPKPAKPAKPAGNGSRPWVLSDTSCPAGSEFTTDYKGTTYSGIVKDGKLELSDGHKFTTPSAAAMHITGGRNVNGWRFWKCRLPSASQFVLIERLRGKAH
jgi:Restriction Enzyme Adenine Methylase Associated